MSHRDGRGGDVDADFDALFRAHYARLVRSLSAAGDGAADAVQEAFVQALLRWRKVSAYDDPIAWVRRVAVHRMLNEHRSRRRRDAAVARLGPVGAADPPDDVEARAGDLDAVIATLSARQRMALVLHYFDDLPVAQVADTMGITAGAVKYHLHEARARLRRALERDRG